MKHIILSILLATQCLHIEAQNLIPNSSFENNTGCPSNNSQANLAAPWFTPTTNIPTVSGTPDYYTGCATSADYSPPVVITGYQPARTGTSYMGIYLEYPTFANYREYIEVPFTSTLLAGKKYHFEMYVNNAYAYKYTTDDIGVYFSGSAVTGINNYTPLPFTPQITNAAGNIFDTLNWTLVSGNYTALGGENHLIIGNFKDDATTHLIPLYSLDPGHYLYVMIDDVSLVETNAEGVSNQFQNSVSIAPNPCHEKCVISVSDKTPCEILLYSTVGNVVYSKMFNASISIDMQGLTDGIYFYQIKDTEGHIAKGKLEKRE